MAHTKASNASDGKDPPKETHSGTADPSVTDAKEAAKSAAAPGALLVNMTCFGCRVSKVKCDKFFPCGRCTRLGVECVEQSRKIGVGGFAAAKRKALGLRGAKGTKRHGYKSKKKLEKSTKKGRRSKRHASKASVVKDERDKEEEDQAYVPMMYRQANPADRRLRALARTRDTDHGGAAASPSPKEGAHKHSHADGCQHLEERKQPPEQKEAQYVGLPPQHGKEGPVVKLRPSGPMALKTANEIIRSTFFELHADGLLDNTRVLQILHSWGLMATRHAHEGLANSVSGMAAALGFDGRTFLEGGEPVTVPPAITESDISPFLRELYVNGAPAMVHLMARGESRFHCNSHWNDLFMPEDTCNRSFLKTSALPYDIFALGVSPEDREELFQACGRLLFSAHGDTADMSKIVKSCYTGPDGREHEVLALHRVRVEVRGGGDLLGLAMCVHSLPESKYLDAHAPPAPDLEEEDDFDLLDDLPGPEGQDIVLVDGEECEGEEEEEEEEAHPLSDDEGLDGCASGQTGGGGGEGDAGVGQWLLAGSGSELDFLNLDKHGLAFLLAPELRPPTHTYEAPSTSSAALYGAAAHGHSTWGGGGQQAASMALSGPSTAEGASGYHQLAVSGGAMGGMGGSSCSSFVGYFTSQAAEASPRGVSMFPGLQSSAHQPGFAEGLRDPYSTTAGQPMAAVRTEHKGASDAMDWCSVYQPADGKSGTGGRDHDRMDDGDNDASSSGSRSSALHCDEAGVDMMIAPPQNTLLPLW